MLRHDIRTQAKSRHHWPDLLKVCKDDKELDLLDKYMVITLDNMKKSRAQRPAEHNAAATNLYIAIWDTIGSYPKSKVIPHQEKINGDGPTLLRCLLTKFHGTAAQIIRAQRSKMEQFKHKLKHYGGDIEKFADHMRKTYQSLVHAGGQDKQAFERMYEALTQS